MYSPTIIVFLSFAFVVLGHPISSTGENQQEPVQVEVRSPPITYAAEAFLQYILRNDNQKCMLKMVCTVGANVTRFGSYGDMLTSYFGYYYNPFNFTVSEIPHMLNKLRPSPTVVSAEVKGVQVEKTSKDSVQSAVIDPPTPTVRTTKAPYIFFRNHTMVNPYGFTSSIFSYQYPVAGKVAGAVDEVQGRSALPGLHVFNRAFVQGYKNGDEYCRKTFTDCNMDVDLFLQFASNMMAITSPTNRT